MDYPLPLDSPGNVIDTQRPQADWQGLAQHLDQQFGKRFQTSQALRQQHGHTTTWIETQAPDGVVYPESTQDVAAIVALCKTHNVPIIPFGVGTSLEGQVNAPEGGLSIDMSRMNAVLSIHADDFDCVVQPGVTRKQLNSLLRDQGLFFPIDPGADATMGGMASTRASGTNAVRYGTMRETVISLEAVLANGEIVRTGQRARKSAAGYDLTALLIGSEGTLGIITELTLRLYGIPETTGSVIATFPTIKNASEAVIETMQYGVQVSRIELLDHLTVRAVNAYSNLNLEETPLLLVEINGSKAGVEEHSELFRAIVEEHDGTVAPSANSPEERNRIWQARHDAYWATLGLRPGAKGIATDVCVPISRLADCITKAQERAEKDGLLAPLVGHVGDGNFHVLPLINMDDAEEVKRARSYVSWLNELAISADGTCSGEHGIGQGKQRYLRQELGGAVDTMAILKRALDPQNLFNPGKIFA